MSSLNEYVRLLPYGYAPGNYMSKCFACEKVFPDMDKRATRCRPCAEAAFKDHEIERLRAEVVGLREELEAARQVMRSVRVFVTGREKIKHPEGTEWFDSAVTAIDAALAARKGEATTPPPSPSPRS